MPDLTTLARVKRYLAIPTVNQDAVIAELIPGASRQVVRYCSREFPSVQRVAQRLSGHGGRQLVLPDAPILSVESLTVDGKTITPSSDGLTAPGYVNDDTSLLLIGSSFTKARMNVVVSWTAGFQGSETLFIPAGNTPTLGPDDWGFPAAVVSVTRVTNGAAMTQVGASPAVGQFTFVDGIFTFNTGDAGSQVVIVYRFVPSDVERAAIEMVGLDLKQRDNLGIQAKSMAGENVTYTDKGMTASAREILKPYRRCYPA